VTLQVGDKAVAIPLRDGGRVTVRSGTISVGDKAVLIPGANGQIYAVRPASPQVGDKVIVYPLRNGGHVCLASADDEGGSSPSVMPPGNFNVMRTGPSTADLKWLPGEGNTAVRIVRRPDRYPTHINDGAVAYEGAGDELTDSGLDFRLPYYYCAWGKAGSKYSNGYLMDAIPKWGTQSDPVLVTLRDWRMATEIGEVVDYGTEYYHWDGQGRVWLSSSPSAKQNIQWDNEIRVSTQHGTLDWYQGPQVRIPQGSVSSELIDLTSYLRQGVNYISIQIRELPTAPYLTQVGAYSDIYIMRTL
jgi:hypothetical protein